MVYTSTYIFVYIYQEKYICACIYRHIEKTRQRIVACSVGCRNEMAKMIFNVISRVPDIQNNNWSLHCVQLNRLCGPFGCLFGTVVPPRCAGQRQLVLWGCGSARAPAPPRGHNDPLCPIPGTTEACSEFPSPDRFHALN